MPYSISTEGFDLTTLGDRAYPDNTELEAFLLATLTVDGDGPEVGELGSLASAIHDLILHAYGADR